MGLIDCLDEARSNGFKIYNGFERHTKMVFHNVVAIAAGVFTYPAVTNCVDDIVRGECSSAVIKGGLALLLGSLAASNLIIGFYNFNAMLMESAGGINCIKEK